MFCEQDSMGTDLWEAGGPGAAGGLRQSALRPCRAPLATFKSWDMTLKVMLPLGGARLDVSFLKFTQAAVWRMSYKRVQRSIEPSEWGTPTMK